MEIRQLLGQLMSKNIVEYLSGVPGGGLPIPRLYPPASAERIAMLEERADQPLEGGYRELLALTDGMDGFGVTMSVLGCHDWDEGRRATAALAFLEGVREDGTAEDVGLPEDVGLFPVSVDADGSRAVFMLNRPDVLPERYWWIGEGSSSFFGTLADLLGHAIDPRAYSPREEIG
ncbi:SMI1/KNR4 family protein [Streptomyces sp. NPDC029041]|uniref:SMI1/KNR4 family protein n=1 Tax=Streptomyces sp. NPDC029041 TaxID=3155727 RepID=UPI0033C9CE0D